MQAKKIVKRTLRQRNRKSRVWLFNRKYKMQIGYYPLGTFRWTSIKREQDEWKEEIIFNLKPSIDLSDQEPLSSSESKYDSEEEIIIIKKPGSQNQTTSNDQINLEQKTTDDEREIEYQSNNSTTEDERTLYEN